MPKKLSKLLGFGDATMVDGNETTIKISWSDGRGFFKSVLENLFKKNGIDMFENGEWIEEGVIQVSEDEMKDVLKYIYGGIK